MTNEDRKTKIAELRAEADRLERERKRDPIAGLLDAKDYFTLIWTAPDRGFGPDYMTSVAKSAMQAIDERIAALSEPAIKTPDAPEVNVEAGYVAIPWQNAGEGDEYMIDGKWWKSGGGGAHPQSPGAYSWRRKTDAPEPTGAQLVGKAVYVCDAVNGVWCTESCGAPTIVVEYNPDSTLPYTVQSGNHWRFARLAKDRP